jgi:hypothetical protein
MARRGRDTTAEGGVAEGGATGGGEGGFGTRTDTATEAGARPGAVAGSTIAGDTDSIGGAGAGLVDPFGAGAPRVGAVMGRRRAGTSACVMKGLEKERATDAGVVVGLLSG